MPEATLDRLLLGCEYGVINPGSRPGSGLAHAQSSGVGWEVTRQVPGTALGM